MCYNGATLNLQTPTAIVDGNFFKPFNIPNTYQRLNLTLSLIVLNT